MKKMFLTTTVLSTIFGFSAVHGPALAQRDYSNVEIKTTQVTDDIYMLEGAGGNIGLSIGDDGAFVIDDQFAPLSDKIAAAISALTDKPVEFVLNTHHHGDHTGGNEALGKSGAYIISHDNVHKRLSDAKNTSPDALPVITFSHSATFHRNGHEIYVKHPENAHTDGDSIVFFKNANVIHMGDVFFSGGYPYIDLKSGGSLSGYIQALEYVASLADDETKIIPGHGPLSSKVELDASIAMLKTVRSRVQAQIDEGLSEAEAIAARPLDDLDEEWGSGFMDSEFTVKTAYQSLKAE
ncbi:MAG: cyclase [Hyphococcus sp.]|nr:MAG: cyclase [Marinicaulis sp.]